MPLKHAGGKSFAFTKLSAKNWVLLKASLRGKYFHTENERQVVHRYGPSAAQELLARYGKALECKSALLGQLPLWLILREDIYYLQSSLARHCGAEPSSSWSSWGKLQCDTPALHGLGQLLFLVPGAHLPKVNPSQILELCQPPKDVCGHLSAGPLWLCSWAAVPLS